MKRKRKSKEKSHECARSALDDAMAQLFHLLNVCSAA